MKCTNYCFKPLGLLFLLCLIPLWAFSQNITVKGVVKDATGESVIGAERSAERHQQRYYYRHRR